MITLVYHRPLDESLEAAARELAAAMDVQLIGRSRKQKIVIGRTGCWRNSNSTAAHCATSRSRAASPSPTAA
jgi:hypothetical protein